jgi:hypothetical protein
LSLLIYNRWLTEVLITGKTRLNYAYPGAVTDSKLVTPTIIIPGTNVGPGDLVGQVDRHVSDGKTYAPNWSGTNSLFFVPGSNTGNDVVNSWRKGGDLNSLVNSLIGSLDTQIERVGIVAHDSASVLTMIVMVYWSTQFCLLTNPASRIYTKLDN